MERYQRWCLNAGQPFLPTTLKAVVHYLREQGPQVSHGGFISALRWGHRVNGVVFPTDEHGILAALARRGRRLGPKKPIPDALHPRVMVDWWRGQRRHHDQPWATMVMCLLSLGLRMGLRSADVEHLSVGDFKVHDGVLAVMVRDGKSDHLDRVAPTTYIEPSRGGRECCPFRWTSAWLQHRTRNGAIGSDPMFTHDGTAHGARLSRDSVGEVLRAVRDCASKRDKSTQNQYYTGKSLRRGMATIMAAAGMSTQQIMAMGRWKTSDMPARYTAEWAPALAGASSVLDATAEAGLMPFLGRSRGASRRCWTRSRLCAPGVRS